MMSHLLPRRQPMRMAVSFEVPHETADRLSFKTWKFADMWLLLPQLLSPWPMHRAMSRRSARPVCQMRLAKFFLVFLANIANMTWCCARTASMATSSLDAALLADLLAGSPSISTSAKTFHFADGSSTQATVWRIRT